MAAYNTNDLARIYRKARGVGENALSMLTSGFAEPAAGYAAAAAAATGYDAEGARNAIRERMTYAPKTTEGIQYMNALARVMSAVNDSAPVTTWKKGVDIAGRYSPAAGAALQTVPAAIGVAAGYKPAMAQGRAASYLAEMAQKKMVQNAMAPRRLHPQRGVIMFRGGAPKGEAVTWYASEKKLADDYARYRGVDSHEADIQVAKPFDAGRTINEVTPREFAIRALQQAGYKDKSAIDLIKRFSDYFGEGKIKTTDFWSDPKSAAFTRDFLRDAGFDSINIDEDGVMTTAVFNKHDPR